MPPTTLFISLTVFIVNATIITKKVVKYYRKEKMNNNSYLNELESKSIYIIREAYWEYKDKLAVLWSMGKDSTTLMYLIRKAFLGDILIPIIHIDTGFKFK